MSQAPISVRLSVILFVVQKVTMVSWDQTVFSAFQETAQVDTRENHMEVFCTDLQRTGTHALKTYYAQR